MGSSGGGWAVRWQQTGRARGGLEGGPGQAPPLPRSPPWPRKASCSDLHWQNIKGRPDKELVAGLSGKSGYRVTLGGAGGLECQAFSSWMSWRMRWRRLAQRAIDSPAGPLPSQSVDDVFLGFSYYGEGA